jgi:hypothetical protein
MRLLSRVTRMRATFRLLLPALLALAFTGSALADAPSQTITPAEFVKDVGLVDRNPLTPESFKLRPLLMQWASSTQAVAFKVAACSSKKQGCFDPRRRLGLYPR